MPKSPSPVTVSDDVASLQRTYECAVLLPALLSQKERSEAIKTIEGYFAEKQATQLAKHEWGRRGLAYRIKGSTEGEYIIYIYSLNPADLHEISEALRLEKKVLRYLLKSTEEGSEIIDWGKRFQEWLKEREQEKEDQERAHEEELKKKIVRRAAKKVVVKQEETPKTAEKSEEIKEEELEEKLGELISDEDLNL